MDRDVISIIAELENVDPDALYNAFNEKLNNIDDIQTHAVEMSEDEYRLAEYHVLVKNSGSDIIGRILGTEPHKETPSDSDEVRQLIDYCKSMKMSYSYKAVLLLALIDTPDLSVSISDAVAFFRDYYYQRKINDQKVEKKNCLFQRDDITNGEIVDNILRNPVNALLKSSYFEYDDNRQIFSVKRVIAAQITDENREEIRKACDRKLKAYYTTIR